MNLNGLKIRIVNRWNDVKNILEFFHAPKKWERREIPSNFCRYCDHYHTEHTREVCFKCRNAKEKDSRIKLISNHKFNEEPPIIVRELSEILHDANFQDDTYYMLVLMKSIQTSILTEIEKSFGWTLKEIRVSNHDKNYLCIIFYKTTIFCRYCHSPHLTIQDRMEHEQSTEWGCYMKPKEVTFVG